MARTVGSTAADTRRRILDAALELFVERGYAGTTIRHIADHLGMTKGALYYHFSSKEDLLHTLMAPVLASLDDFVGRARAAERPLPPQLLGELVDLYQDHALVIQALATDPSVAVKLGNENDIQSRLVQLDEVLSGGDSPVDRLRGRCALGLIHMALFTVIENSGPVSANGNHVLRAGSPARMTRAERDFIVHAALAVLATPSPADPPVEFREAVAGELPRGR
jgi:AcrR family transcriptional regulator